MKNSVKPNVFKILCFILAGIVGLAGCLFAIGVAVTAVQKYPVAVSQSDVVRKTAVVVIPGLLCSAIQDTETGEIYYDPIESDEYGFSFDDFSEDAFTAVTEILKLTELRPVNKVFDVINGKADNFLDKFALDETGTPVYPSAAIQWDHDGYAKYGAMTVMRTPYEYYSELFKNKKNCDVFVFQYDWRRDNRIAAADLVKAVEGYDDVITVAHSMGNIVVSLALAQSETFRNQVVLNCSYAAPYYGSYSALGILENGEEMVGSLLNMAKQAVKDNNLEGLLGNLLSKADSVCYDKVLPYFRGMPGIVQLLPTIDLVCPDGEHSNLTVNGVAIKTREQLLDYYQSCFWAHTEMDLTQGLRSWAADLGEYWDAFYVNGVHASKLVNTYYFAGYDVRTTNSMTIEKAEDGTVTHLTSTSGEGDGTVPYLSATLGQEDKVLRTAGYSHTELGIGIKKELVTEQTKEAVRSLDKVRLSQSK